MTSSFDVVDYVIRAAVVVGEYNYVLARWTTQTKTGSADATSLVFVGSESVDVPNSRSLIVPNASRFNMFCLQFSELCAMYSSVNCRVFVYNNRFVKVLCVMSAYVRQQSTKYAFAIANRQVLC